MSYSRDCIGEGKTQEIPSTAQSLISFYPAFATPTTASRFPSLEEGGLVCGILFSNFDRNWFYDKIEPLNGR